MTDVLTPEQRRFNMSRIRGRDTKPEMLLRRALHARGLRFRLHRKDLPGRPDLVFAGFRAIVFVHGCFWHNHHCPQFKWPATRKEFWNRKINANVERDRKAQSALLTSGWRVLVIWECSMRGRTRRPLETVVDEIVRWIQGYDLVGIVEGGSLGSAGE